MDPHCTPPPSVKGRREIREEAENGSPLTFERARTFQLMRQRAGVGKHGRGDTGAAVQARNAAIEQLPELLDSYRRTPLLSAEGSREVEEEMVGPPADTPGRRALFERVEVRAAMRRRVEEMELKARTS